MMPITHEHLGVDPDLGRRILVLARIIAPCIEALPDDSPLREDAIAILRGVADEAQQLPPRSLASTGVGPMRETYRDIGSCFTEDDRTSLRSLCGLTSAPGLPLGSFPDAGLIGRMWPETHS
jgi:hypothetical protein